MLAVVVSRADEASVAIGRELLDAADWTERRDDDRPDADGGGAYHRLPDAELRTFDALHLHLDDVAAAFDDPDLLAFASRHAGDTGALLTAHSTGNFGPAEYGGEDGALARAAPNALARVLGAFDEHAPAGYDTGLEATHHGPTSVGCPSLFVELGSGEAQWRDSEGARAVARAILALRGVAPDRERTVVGYGGGHYVPRFDRVVRETDWAVGHVAADWGLDAMGDPADNRDLIAAAFERSGATRALLDGDRPELERVVRELGHDVVGERWLRETTGVPLAIVAAFEDALVPVADGLRFGAPAREGTAQNAGGMPAQSAEGTPAERDAPAFERVDLPAELLAEADGADRDAVREAVHRRALAYETREGGTRVAGAVALPDGDALDGVVDALCDVLRGKYDEVVREGDAVVARAEAFDPALAAELGVPEGPAFGELAAGRAVEVDGREVTPEEVHRARETRFPL